MITVTPQSALLVVDVQKDFLPGGALAVPGGDEIIPVINHLARLPFGVVIATQDWHPADHMSFVTQGGPWPVHCVAGTDGATLAALLDDEPVGAIFRKGRSRDVDSYSAFFDNEGKRPSGLVSLLKELGITRVFVTGLALDVCVSATADDAVKAGFEAVVIADACRGTGPAEPALADLRRAGVTLTTSDRLA